MIKLSEIIKTDCYIDCGSNEKLREVYPLIDLREYGAMERYGIDNDDIYIINAGCAGYKGASESLILSRIKTVHHISQIDLKG
jgi:hypothetical protein